MKHQSGSEMLKNDTKYLLVHSLVKIGQPKNYFGFIADYSAWPQLAQLRLHMIVRDVVPKFQKTETINKI